MGRQLRPRLPGAPFHITARTQGQEPLFEGAEEHVVAIIRDSVLHSDTELLAYAVMQNHIHVIVVQGRRPLSGYMQPLLRRIALLVNGRKSRQGHVFSHRYSHSACHDPEYFRSMITYVHLNPVRAGLCKSPDAYRWSSHGDYARGAAPETSARYALAVDQAVRVFAGRSDQPVERCRRDYRAFVRWRLAMDAYLGDESDDVHRVPRLRLSLGGDLHWHREYGSARLMRATGTAAPPARRPDLRDHVLIGLRELDAECPMDLLRSGGRTKPLVRIRTQLIARALSAGYAGTTIAEFLNISQSSVSRVKSMLRRGVAW